jgi:hypothetical protein
MRDDETHPVTIFLFVHFTGYARMQSNIKNGERQSTATAYLRPIHMKASISITT